MTNLGQSPAREGVSRPDLAPRIIRRILPLLILCMATATLDRSNIGFAKLGMRADLGLTEQAFGLGASLLFVGYVAFEVPSTLLAHRFGARLWFARILTTWGVATLLLGFCRTDAQFYLLRFAIGAAEAGLYPAEIFYLTLWFDDRERTQALGLFTLGSAAGNALSGLICGPLLDLNHILGLAGWQWIFVITGLLPLGVAVAVLRWLPDGPKQARFLSPSEKDELIERRAPRAGAGHKTNWLAALTQPAALAYALFYVLLVTSLYGVIYWAPTVLKSLGVSGSWNGLLNAVPWLLDGLVLLWATARLRSASANAKVGLAASLAAAASFAASALVHHPAAQFGALLVGIPGVSLAIACFWRYPMALQTGGLAAALIASISTVGNVGGFAAQNLMPAMAALGRSPSVAMWLPCILMALAVPAFALALRHGTIRGDAPAAI